MASSTDQALEVINQSYKDILIQAGKHFRVMAKDGPGALNGTHNGIQARASEALAQYHLALNEIESEIIRARSVLLRDLENLNAARAPALVATPVPAPVPIPTPQATAPPAPMMELPYAAAHSRNLNTAVASAAVATYTPSKETRTVAPFPDMGTGMSSDVVDLTAGEKKPSPRFQAGSIKATARTAPSTNVKPSPKPVHKPIPPAKVTPVPPPQIPRLQSTQSSNSSAQSKSQPTPNPPKTAPPIQPAQPPQQAPAVKTVQDNAMGNTPSLPVTKATDEAGAGTGGGELNFTHMEFSLAPPPNEPQGAPPAPMPEFDLASFAPQGGNNNNAVANNTAGSHTMQASSTSTNTNMDDLFNLGDTNGGGDNMFDLGGGEANDSTFDDLMFFGNNDTDMAQFDDAYFGI
ncbi:hypothetical protein F5B22DRAFT_158937 [Xylaria bambusicola]|uniref:uncharacterized protein n=1 Tax=Xylaria bambusicola TaxID=326684 RepID=UPI002007A770|nr:uncharacterized protein F5B22DRAFT_158937 [Xylaria bambusicola]KAI0526456.1 hypothetical protein F5B22DRAFT_158937 [Xylaria bambusicola]